MRGFINVITLIICVVLFLPMTSFALSLANGEIIFDIPETLELRSKELEEINDSLMAIIAKKENLNYTKSQLILQQKGLNDNNIDSLEQHCLILLKILPPYEQGAFTNSEFAQIIKGMSAVEINNFNQAFIASVVQNNPLTHIHQWLETNSAVLGGKFALKYHYDRYSNDMEKRNQLIDVCVYLIITKSYLINIICSYRVDEKHLFEPAVNQFLSSLRIKTE